MNSNIEKKLGLPALIGMVVGSMIGAGIFSLGGLKSEVQHPHQG